MPDNTPSKKNNLVSTLSQMDNAPKPKISEGTISVVSKLLSMEKDDKGCAMVLRQKVSHLVKNGRPDFEYLLGSSTTQISTLKREMKFEQVATIIFAILKNLSDSFNVSRGMSDAALQELSVDVMEDLWSVRIEELIAFAYGLKKGHYIKVYERLDVSVFWEAWRVYEDSKLDHLQRIHTDKKNVGFREDKPRDQLGDKLDGLLSGLDAVRPK